MGFVTLSDGTLIHTSQIMFPGEKRPAKALGNWQDVWERHDQTPREGDDMGSTPTYYNPTTRQFFHGRGVVIEELTRIVVDSYTPRYLRWIITNVGRSKLADDDFAYIRQQIAALWRQGVRVGNA